MSLELLLFTNRTELAQRALTGGASGIVIDWERRGKSIRQAGADTVIAADTAADLERMRAAVQAPVLCRLDAVGPATGAQLRRALALGTDEVLVPMVRSREEVELVLELVRGRCGVGILVETVEALEVAGELATLPLSRVLVGLNDLAIERRSPSIFTAFVDGTVDELRSAFAELPFGCGGATVPGAGYPMPASLMLSELVRVGADFTLLRRSFWQAAARVDPALAVGSIKSALRAAATRDADAIAADHAEFARRVAALSERSAAAAVA